MTYTISRIALCGPAGSGKSTVAMILERELGYSAISTGAVVRELSRKLFATEEREKLNLLGQTLLELDPTLILRIAIQRTSLCENRVFDSIRCEADLSYCVENGFSIVRIASPFPMRMRRLSGRGQAHSTAMEYDLALERFHLNIKADFEFENSGDLPDLRKKLLQLATGC